KNTRPGGRADASGRELILHGERHAVQRAERRAAHDGIFRGARRRERAVASHGDVRTHATVETVAAIEIGPRELDLRQMLVADQGGLAHGAEEEEVVVHPSWLTRLVTP